MTRGAQADRFAEAIGRQLAHPFGIGGCLVGVIMRVANRRPTRALIEALDIGAEHHVLDVGCGDGTTLASIPHAASRCGIDQSEAMLTIAGRRLRGAIAMGSVSLYSGDMLELPVESCKFDRIIASNLLYFCRDVPTFVSECRRVAKPGALLGIYVTSAASMAKWRFAGPATHRHFTREELERELGEAQVDAGNRTIRILSLPGGIEGFIAVARLSSKETPAI